MRIRWSFIVCSGLGCEGEREYQLDPASDGDAQMMVKRALPLRRLSTHTVRFDKGG